VLNDILNDFLSIGKIEEGKIVVTPVRINIRESITNSIQELAGMQKEGQQIYYEHKGGEWTELDPVLLKHIINNLVSNAIKFSPENSNIDIMTGWENGRLKLTVKDEGIGIPEEYKGHLFERFYRASNAINIQGTGLGLHIVSKYLELMGGEISFESELYKGSVFEIVF
jgi:signal transduction histidine kinase